MTDAPTFLRSQCQSPDLPAPPERLDLAPHLSDVWITNMLRTTNCPSDNVNQRLEAWRTARCNEQFLNAINSAIRAREAYVPTLDRPSIHQRRQNSQTITTTSPHVRHSKNTNLPPSTRTRQTQSRYRRISPAPSNTPRARSQQHAGKRSNGALPPELRTSRATPQKHPELPVPETL